MRLDLYSEGEIISGCRQGKRRFQELLYRRYAQKMYGICLSYAGERPLAQDMLQEAFIKVFRNIENFREEGSLEGWIRRIVVNTAIDILKQKANIIDKYFFKEEIVRASYHTESEALPKLQIDEILGLIARLPKGARVIFNLFAVEGYTHREIAEQLNISEGTSKSQYNRARDLLRNWLENLNGK